MKPKTRLVLNEFGFTIAGWLLLNYLYYIAVIWGPAHLYSAGPLKDYMTSNLIHAEIGGQALLSGIMLALTNYATEWTPLRRRSFGQIILIKSVLYLMALALAGWAVYVGYLVFDIMPDRYLEMAFEMLTPAYAFSLILYFTASILALNFVLEVRRKFGPKNLLRLLTGRYHRPKIEHRIFLFLDLKGSTTIAEQLGHTEYSRFIRRCFHDLTDLVVRYDAEVYQYVGDEVVLSWKAETGMADANCFQIFFDLTRRLEERRSKYEALFGVAPVFRGGMDMGIVTAAEVGDIKREIAYHGDVLNTAARLQGLCKTYNQGLLISERVHRALVRDQHFVTTLQGEVTLRGKIQPIGVYSITERNGHEQEALKLSD